MGLCLGLLKQQEFIEHLYQKERVQELNKQNWIPFIPQVLVDKVTHLIIINLKVN